MACADGAMTGRPGIAFVTRGPGATNASIGVHVAFQDSQPLILFVGDVARGMRGREGFQEIDFPAFFGPIAKWAARIDDAARIPEFVARAYATRSRAARARWCWRCPRTCCATRSMPPPRRSSAARRKQPAPAR